VSVRYVKKKERRKKSIEESKMISCSKVVIGDDRSYCNDQDLEYANIGRVKEDVLDNEGLFHTRESITSSDYRETNMDENMYHELEEQNSDQEMELKNAIAVPLLPAERNVYHELEKNPALSQNPEIEESNDCVHISCDGNVYHDLEEMKDGDTSSASYSSITGQTEEQILYNDQEENLATLENSGVSHSYAVRKPKDGHNIIEDLKI